MNVIVLGAAGQLGREMVRAVASRGHTVTAFVRRPPVEDFPCPVRLHVGDALNPRDLAAAFRGNEVTINAIGSGTLRCNDVESSTTAAAVRAAREAGIGRYFAVSAGMVALDSFVFQYFIRPLVFRNVYAEHLRVEKLVMSGSLNWTIVRPPKLVNSPASGYVASLDRIPPRITTTRADVAAFVADEMIRSEYQNRAVFVWSRPR